MSDVIRLSGGINIYNETAFERIKVSAKLASSILGVLIQNAVPGVSTKYLDELAEKLIHDAGAEPLFKGYEGFPNTICTSNNEFIVHGVPDDTPLKVGDVLTIDIGLRYMGYCGDTARTVCVGDPTGHQGLLKAAEAACKAGIQAAVVGGYTGDIGFEIFKSITCSRFLNKGCNSGYKVFPNFRGHGIGLELHEEPPVLNVSGKGTGVVLVEGMCLCVEPVVVYEGSDIKTYINQGVRQFITTDGRPSVQYEDQIFITNSGPIILT